MFKLESYVTPILLSYVDKYIKNLKPEDSQVSLWGGDAVFNNLDLRLDVLEHELQLPFTFVNGHIHELRIHVPWTKLGSEPIVITINTIECILKLKDAVDSSGSETNSNRSSNSAKQKSDFKRKYRRNELEDIPPSYVQSLISRITNNISIVCNNLILKYVEGDIVLSLNVKAAQMCSANENWEKAFIDLTLPDLVLRKLIELQDLTVCLDRRNASGKIETYQDPLLYRCSLEGRLYLAYDSTTSKVASVSRINLLCDNLELSITDQQLPMFVRLLQLCVALYFGEIDLTSSTDTVAGGNEASTQAEEEYSIDENMDQDEESWGTWAWSFIPQLLPYEDEDEEERAKGTRVPPPILHLGMYVNKASFAFKLSESADGIGVFTPQKFAFQTFGCLFLEGGFLDVVMRNPDCVNVQMGVSSLKLNTVGPCVCPEHELTNFISGMDYSFISCGSFLSERENSHEYFAASLFDKLAPENNGQRREYNFDWDDHFNEVTESKLMERSPTFVMDYFYLLELPEDNDKSSTLSISDLENSNLKERTLGRFLFGPILFNATGAVVHRLQKFLHCAQDREYEPYSQPRNEIPDENIPTPSVDDINSLEEFIPFKSFFVSITQPVIKIYAADHPYCDVSKPFSGKKKKKKRRSSEQDISHLPPVLPIAVFHATRLELQLSQAMYPKRLVKIASMMHPPSENLLHHCHSHLSIKVFGFEVNLDSTTKNVNGNINIFPPCSGAVYIKSLLLPEFWKNPFQTKSEITFEIPRLTVRATWPQLQLLLMLAKSWLEYPLRSNQFLELSIMEDVFGVKSSHSLLEASITGIEWKTCYTDNLYAHIGWISAIGVYFQGWRGEQLFTTMLLHGPEDTSQISSASFFNEPVNNQTVDFLLATDRCLNIVIQFPNKKDSATAPSIFMVNMKGISTCLDPRLLDWMSYKPKRYPPVIQTPTLVHQEISVKNENAEVQSKGSAPSSTPLTAPTDNQTQSKSYSAFFPIFGSQGEAKEEEAWVDYAVNLYAILSKLVLQVELELCTVFLPSSPVPNEQGPGNIVRSHHQVFAAGWLPDTLVVNLPRVSLRNGTQKHLLQSLLQDMHIPVINLDIWNAGGDLFPWSLSLSSFGCYSLHKSQEILYCFHPSSASATFALTTKNNLPASDKLTHLSLCIHADMEPLCLSICKRQVKLINEVTEILMGMINHCYSLIADLNCTVDPVVPAVFLVPTSVATKKQPQSLIQQVSLTSTSIIETIDNVSHQCYSNFDVKNAKGKDEGGSKSSDGKVKLSLWLQWTLPKLSINLMCSERALINMEIEEIITSLDVQDIYCKVKLKVSAVNCNYYQNSLTDPDWKPGPFEGIIFSCSDKLTKVVHMPNTKSDSSDTSSNWNYFEPPLTKPSESSHAFLSLTFTRAQCHNVQRRWAHILQDNINDIKVLDLHSPLQRYVSEIDVKILPFDCVLWSPILANAINLIEPLWSLSKKTTQFSTAGPSDVSNQSNFMSKFNNNTLPLLYINAGMIRIFIPQSSAIQNLNSTLLKSSPDMCIFQVGSMYLTPQIDNPLSRIILQREIYSIAQQTRIISMPGSEVEDRQYQLDISGICFATGTWNNLIQCSACKVLPSVSSHLRTMGENPALEWNNKPLSVRDGSDESAEVVFLPLASLFNIRILIAPAIVYQQYSSIEEPPQDILVCGHSFEVNVTTDLDFYLGLHQMSLLYSIYQTNLTHIINMINSVGNKSKTQQERQSKNAFFSNNLESVRPDSGIESDISTLKTGQRLESTIIHGISHVNLIETPHLDAQKELNLNTKEENKAIKFVPFDILLTAGSISFMVYTNESYRSPSKVKEQPKKQVPKKKKFKQHVDSRLEEKSKQQVDSHSSAINLEKESHNVSQLELVKSFKEDLGQDGYEGSEENDDCDEEELLQVPSSFSEITTIKECSNIKNIFPIVYFIFSQPHTFIRCHYSSQKLEMSCYNINMKGAVDGFNFQETDTKLLPSPEDYTVHWIETKPGEPNPKTGIPPALLTLTLTNFLDRPADLKIQVDRPLAVNVSITKYEQILDFIRIVQDVTIGNISRDLNLPTVEDYNANKSLEKKIHHWRLLLSNVTSFHFKTVQLVLTVKTVPHKENSQVFLSLGQMTGDINFIVGSTGLIEDIQMEVFLDRYGVKTSFCEKVLPFIGPSSTNISVNAVWENWNAMAPFPQLCVNIETEAFFINFGRDHLACLEIILNHFQSLLKLSEIQYDAGNSSDNATEKDKTFNKFHFSQEAGQSWLDDLRVGTFQYIQDSEDNGLQPGPNEIVFCREQATQPASMTWCYEQPRVLTKAEIYPVPFRAASESSNVVSPEIQEEQVSCVLQYWDPLMQSFITYQSFQLSETQHCILDLPQFDLEGNKEVIVAHKWRVVLNYCENEDELDEPLKKRSLVSPLALAACMRVDSYFHPCLIPNIQVRFAFNLIQTTLSNHLQHLGKAIPNQLQPFKFDSTIPSTQDFLVISLENFILVGKQWFQKMKVDWKSAVHCKILEYRNLTMKTLTEPCNFHLQLYAMDDKVKPSVVEVTLIAESLFLHVGQAAVHTLNMAIQAWKQPAKKKEKQLLMNYYTICNNTQETLRFGQVDLEESIILHSNEMHAYSWRSHKSKQLLHVCIVGMRWKWCEPFSIDKCGIQVRKMKQKGQKATLIIRVKSLNKIQKQVIISGQVVVSNRLNKNLEVKFVTCSPTIEDVAKSNVGANLEHTIIVGKQTTAPSCIINPEMLRNIYIRLKGTAVNWSHEIPISLEKNQDHQLVKLFMKEKDQFINVWCKVFIQQIESVSQIMILLSPLYIVRTHLPCSLNLIITTPGLGQMHSVEVQGKGEEFQLNCPGEADLTHQLAFQLSHGMEISKPSLPLSTNMVSQVTQLPALDHVDVDDLSKGWASQHMLYWPYDDDDDEECGMKEISSFRDYDKLQTKHGANKKSEASFCELVPHQPDIELKVCLVQRWPGCNTLLVDVKPWCLIINHSKVDLILQSPDEKEWKILDAATFAPPDLEGIFKFGVFYEDEIYYSEPLKMTNEDWTIRQNWPKVHGILPKEGHIQCSITISTAQQQMVCLFTVESKERHGIQVISIRPSYFIRNNTDCDLSLACCCVLNSVEKIEFLPHSSHCLHVPSYSNADNDKNLHPVLFWELFQLDTSDDPVNILGSEHAKYLTFAKGKGQTFGEWSLPFRLQMKPQQIRQAFTIPVNKEVKDGLLPPSLSTESFIVTSHYYKGTVYLFVQRDPFPEMILYNNCDIPLHFGQTCMSSSQEFTTQEESEMLYQLPVISEHVACHYTFPLTSIMFPELRDTQSYPKLHFARALVAKPDSEVDDNLNDLIYWSTGIDTTCALDQFLHIPDCGDIRIHMEHVGNTMHIYLDPVSRVEVSAKEIRSRIREQSWDILQNSSKLIPFPAKSKLPKTKSAVKLSSNAQKNTGSQDPPVAISVSQSEEESCPETEIPVLSSKKNLIPKKNVREFPSQRLREVNIPSLIYISLTLKRASVVLLDEITDPAAVQEIMRTNISRIIMAVRPRVKSASKLRIMDSSLQIRQDIIICIEDLQIDNQMAQHGNYDFSVILLRQDFENKPSSSVSSKVITDLMVQSARNDSLMVVEIVLESNFGYRDIPACLQEVTINMKPLRILLEDKFLYHLMDIVPSFVPVANYISVSTSKEVPKVVSLAIATVMSPIQFQKLTIKPVTLMLSLHASLKLFISLDNTPLVFKEFQRRGILTTSFKLGQALTMHYLSGALIRAGWVVGSLDLIGNPGGFARAIGSGVSDFVRLPYQGLIRSPWAFLIGVAHGSTSLIRQITAGTLMSITNLASSVSRNMERLALDEDYRIRNEEYRRNKPDSLTQGLTQGLTGFGISLLGAIAGIVDQPLQSLQLAVEHPHPPVAAATGLISGVGKGLVGVVAKPLGGAAEFVSQAGQGILRGTGWSKILEPQYDSVIEQASNNTNSQLKYAWKMLPDLQVEMIIAMEATHVNQLGHYVPSILLLTSKVLFLVGIDEDTQQQAFSLSEIDCQGPMSDPTLIYLVPRQRQGSKSPQLEDQNQDRVAEFVNKTTKYAVRQANRDGETESQSDSSTPSPVPSPVPTAMQLYVHPSLRNSFLAHFFSAQQCILGKGFNL